MAAIVEKRNKAGELISYKLMVCVGRDEKNKQIWRTTTIKRPEGLTPAKERKEVVEGSCYGRQAYAEFHLILSRYFKRLD